MIEYEPGGFRVPAKAKASGEYELDVEKGHETFHWDGTREKLGGSGAGWTHLDGTRDHTGRAERRQGDERTTAQSLKSQPSGSYSSVQPRLSLMGSWSECARCSPTERVS